MLDDNRALDRVSRSPFEVSSPDGYFYATDHPAMFHWVNRTILKVLRVEIGPIPKIDPSKDRDWNLAHGRAAPRYPVVILRRANVVALTVGLVFLFFVAHRALGGWLWGFVLAAPLVLAPYVGLFVCGYIQTDAYLAFLICLCILLWLTFHYSPDPVGAWHVVAVSVVIGLAQSTKLNGGLLLLAYMTYLVVMGRGIGRLWRPILAGAVVAAVFFIVNPVMLSRGPFGWVKVIGDMLRIRAETISGHEASLGPLSLLNRLHYLFPEWFLLPLFALFVIKARKERWFLPVAIWASFLIAGTIATANQPFNRYRMPLDLGLATLVTLSAASVIKRLWRHEMTFRDLVT